MKNHNQALFRRIFLALAFFSMIPCAVFSENKQLVIPQKVYVGDTVEIKYLFHSDANIFSEYLERIDRIELSKDYSFFAEQSDSFAVKNIYIERNGSEYDLSLTIVPWKNGILTIPPFDLTALIRESLKKSAGGISFTVKLDSINVHSLLHQKNVTNFMPQSPPLMLPGTTALLAIFSLILVFIMSALVYFASKIPTFAQFIEQILYILSLRHNSRSAIKELNKLLKKGSRITEDKDYAAEIQRIFRSFLRERFSHDFQAVSTGKIYEEFLELFGGELLGFQASAVEKLTEIFFRTDYIRFARDSHFEDGERVRLTKESIQLIFDFNADEKTNGEEESN